MKTCQKGFIAPLLLALIALLLAGGAYVYLQKNQANRSTMATSSYEDKLTACESFANNSTKQVVETDRLFIRLPKDIYPYVKDNVQIKTVKGNAAIGYVSNGGLPGQGLNSTSECWSTYYEFSGNGEVDLTVKSTIKDIPNYLVHFLVGSTSQTTNSQTSNWKTSDGLVYSFKYPQDLIFQSLHSSFVDMTLGQEADMPASYNLPNSFQRSRKIYVGINGAKSKEACMPTQPTSSAQYSVFISPITVAGFVFNKYQTGGDCAMDGCSIGNTYTIWTGDSNCYEVSWFAIQASSEKAYNSGPNDPRVVAAQADAQTTTQKITLLTEQILSTFRFHP